MNRPVLFLLITALASAACGNDSSTTAPSASTGSTESFSGSLGVQGSSFYSFTISTAETVTLSLVSLEASSTAPSSTSLVRLGLGVPLGTDCSVSNSVDTAPGLTAQLTQAVNPDVYCAKISDIGNLTGPLNFTIRIGENATASSPGGASSPVTFASFLAKSGASAQTFTVPQAGTLNLTLTTVTPAATVGMGVGIAGTSPACTLSSSLDAVAGTAPQISIPVDPGTYCVEVYDSGGVTAPGVAFSLTVDRP